MKNTKEGLRFTHLEVENFKSIDKKVINIDGKSLLITGANGAGKSSLIQALLSGIDPKVQPTEAIKKGETKASTKVKIAGILGGEEQEFCIDMYYTPKNQSGRIVLTNSKGETVKSPKEVLKSIIGNISFDIFKFLNDRKPAQIKILKQLSGVEKEIDLLDIDRKKIYDNRTFLNKKIEEDEALMNNHGLSQDEIDLYSEPVDMEPIQAELANISRAVTQYNEVKYKTENFINKASSLQKEIDGNLQRIEELEAQIGNLKDRNDDHIKERNECTENHKKGLAWLESKPEPSATEVSGRITEASNHNKQHERVKQLVEKQKTLMADKQKAQKCTSDIEIIDSKKDALIKGSKLPIKGLTFTEDEIYLDKLPFEEGQINTQRLIDVGAEISMALNPGLRVIFLRDGSLFDQNSLNAFIKKCENRGYQIIAEIVGENPDLSITFTESEE